MIEFYGSLVIIWGFSVLGILWCFKMLDIVFLMLFKFFEVLIVVGYFGEIDLGSLDIQKWCF